MSEEELPCHLNFTTEIEHELTCAACRHAWTRREILRHFSLDMPPPATPSAGPAGSSSASSSAAPPRVPTLQTLLASFFDDDAVDVTCDKCGHGAATVTHRVARLPRVLILHLKRFDHTADGGVRKRAEPVRPLAELDLAPCCRANVEPPPPADVIAAHAALDALKEPRASARRRRVRVRRRVRGRRGVRVRAR